MRARAARAAAVARTRSSTLYLTLAPYGGNLEGVRAATLAYFGKEPKRLTFAEAALLVALPQSPETRRPDRFAAAARRARDRVLDRAVARGVITPREAAAAKARAGPGGAPAVPDARRPRGRGRGRASARTRRSTGSPSTRRLQASLETLARERVDALGPQLSAAILVIDNATRRGPRPCRQRRLPDARERAGAIDMTRALRSPGLGAEAVHLRARLRERPRPSRDARSTTGRRASAPIAPENFDLAFQGTVTARRALQLSLNVPAVELLTEVGPARFSPGCSSAGAEIALPKEAPRRPRRRARRARHHACRPRRASTPASRAAATRRRCVRAARRRAPARRRRAHHRSGRGLVRRRHPARRAAARERARRPHRLQDRHVLRLSATPGRSASTGGTTIGGLGRAAGRRARCRASSAALVAAPILFDAFARLGGEPGADPDAAACARRAPPRRCRRRCGTCARTRRRPSPRRRRAPLKIAFPPDGARIDLGLDAGAGQPAPLALKARAARRRSPGSSTARRSAGRMLRRQSSWRPDGAGFARVSVIDAKGATDSVVVRIE